MPSTTDVASVETRIKSWAEGFDRHLGELAFPATADSVREATPAAAPAGRPQDRLVEAMRYSLLAPGKRLRPYLACRCCELSGGSQEAAVPVAAAIECVHAFSLIHDDLPAMDDDDLRRGRPTCHVKFGEAMAILAGDALLTLAFELIARHAPDDRRAVALTLELARACGAEGMIGGQAADVEGEGLPLDRKLAEYVHSRKTARLFESACRLGAVVADADNEELEALGTYGQHLGRAFQITDDLLDVTSDVSSLGKKAGKDAQLGKQTFPACVGMEESRQSVVRSVQRAEVALQPFGRQADDLRDLARFVGQRRH
jgi:geranylgeranyl diphosphate synthase type II